MLWSVFRGLRSAGGWLGQLLGDAERIGSTLHFVPDPARIDARAAPEHDEVVKDVRAFPNDANRPMLDCSEGHLCGLFDDLLRDLAGSGGQQPSGARMAFGRHLIEGTVGTVSVMLPRRACP
jgi:hypothetical protein